MFISDDRAIYTLYPEDEVAVSILDKAGRTAHRIKVHDYQELLRDVNADVLACPFQAYCHAEFADLLISQLFAR